MTAALTIWSQSAFRLYGTNLWSLAAFFRRRFSMNFSNFPLACKHFTKGWLSHDGQTNASKERAILRTKALGMDFPDTEGLKQFTFNSLNFSTSSSFRISAVDKAIKETEFRYELRNVNSIWEWFCYTWTLWDRAILTKLWCTDGSRQQGSNVRFPSTNSRTFRWRGWPKMKFR